MTSPNTASFRFPSLRYALLILCAITLTACVSSVRAPIENRSVNGNTSTRRVDPATLPGAEFAGKPGYYTVQQGDTIYSIARAYNLDRQDLLRWNSTWVPNPNQIEIGQVLRVAAPAGSTSGTTTTNSSTASIQRPATEPSASSTNQRTTKVDFMWPTKNPVIVTPFDNNKSKGIGLGGKLGDAVLASADGKVMYAGSALRGYGNLIILKHNNTLLTVYAHNSKLLVKEGDPVSKGQQIANMGKSDSDSVKLHFEVRSNSKTVNPLDYLPPR